MIESIIWFIRGIASVVTLSTCVSPRWKSPLPCAVGKMPTSADTGRRSFGPRPSMRTPSLTMRVRTSCLVSERTASLICFSWPAKRPGASAVPASAATVSAVTASIAALRSALSEMRTAGASLAPADCSTAA